MWIECTLFILRDTLSNNSLELAEFEFLDYYSTLQMPEPKNVNRNSWEFLILTQYKIN